VLKAEISPQLLLTIFWVNTELHDGAVMIREGKIEAAGCVLPLSSGRNLSDRKMGTRHRAGLGISEVSDAICVIVSEETGQIAVANGGRMIRQLTAARLKTILQAFYGEPGVGVPPAFWRAWFDRLRTVRSQAVSRQPLRRFIVENAVWLIGSILLAVIVWFAAENQQNPVQQQRFRDTIPVQVLNDGTMLVVNPPSPVEVVVRAPLSVWNILQDGDITVTADLRGQGSGAHTVTLAAALSPERLGAVSEVLPSQITIELAQRSEQIFNISIVQTPGPPVGFEINPPPPQLTTKVSGSDAQVKQVAQVVARVNLSSETKPVTRILQLEAVDAEGNAVSGVVLTPSEVTVDLHIQPRPGVTVLSVSPTVLSATLPQGYLYRATANPATVAVQGNFSAIEAMKGSVATDDIDLTNHTQTFQQAVKLALPPGVTLTDPVNVVVTIQIDAINMTRQFDNIPVQTQGLDKIDFGITVLPNQVTVVVTGPQAAMETLQASDITVIAPLSGLAGGTYTVPLTPSVAHAGLTADNTTLTIPEKQAQVTVVALHPTPTSTITPTPLPTPTASAAATGSATP
jgi:YbbR domain-containing protein